MQIYDSTNSSVQDLLRSCQLSEADYFLSRSNQKLSNNGHQLLAPLNQIAKIRNQPLVGLANSGSKSRI